MKDNAYFEDSNYTGNHLHIDNYTNQFTPFIEAIAWQRVDGTMDVFFDDFEDDEEIQTLFGDSEYFRDQFMGVFLFNVKTNEEAYKRFRRCVADILYTFRNAGVQL